MTVGDGYQGEGYGVHDKGNSIMDIYKYRPI